ncbi:MAG TPA: hypothetical protein VD997_13765 [Phycisphaerales bacterium]|nr:hypothetical protein [Phycisphaerales bacterium]
MAAAGLLVILSAPVLAQATGEPAAREPLPIIERGNEPVEPIKPVPAQRSVPTVRTPDAKDLPNGAAALPAGAKLAEGTFLPSRRGRLLRARTGDVIFVPAKGEQERDLPALVLMPSERLTQIESAMATEGFKGDANVGGQVFVYRGREYLLPSTFAIAASEEPKPTAPPEAKKTAPAPAPVDDTDPRAEDLIRELESQRSSSRALEPNPTPQPTTEAAPQQAAPETRPVLAEGTVMTFRRGRLIRLPGAGGRIAFALDNDPNSPAPAPMVIQACSQLERMESLVAAHADSLAVKVSGRVLTHAGKNYLLPTMVQATRGGEVIPMQ